MSAFDSGSADTLFLVEEHTRPITATTLILPAGALLDPPGKEGLAYLTGQLLLRGAGDMDQAQLADAIDFLGSTLGVSVGRDTTTISGDALTRNFATYQGLVEAVVSAPKLEETELAKLRRQTLAELAQLRENDAGLGQRLFVRTLFDGHLYGRPLKGTEESLAAITIDDVRGFYASHYRTDGPWLLGAAGDIDRPGLEDFASRTVGALPAGAPPAVAVPAAPVPQGIKVGFVDKPDRSQTQVFIGHPTLNSTHPDYLALIVANTVFGGTFTARLSHEIREKRGWSYGAYSYVQTDRRLGTFLMRFYPATEDTLPAVQLADTLYQQLVADGLGEEEVAVARRYLASSHAFALDTPTKKLSQQVGAELHGRPRDFVERFAELVSAVTLDQVNAAIRAHLTPNRLQCVVLATASDLVDSFTAWERVDAVSVVDYLAV